MSNCLSLVSHYPLKYVWRVSFLLAFCPTGFHGRAFTDRGIAALKPSDSSIYHFDSEVSGLAVRVYPSGRKVFVFDWRENRQQRRITIGASPAWTIGKARTHASQLRLKADTGETVVPGRGGRVADLIDSGALSSD